MRLSLFLLLLITGVSHADQLVAAQGDADYSDHRVRYTAKLEPPPVKKKAALKQLAAAESFGTKASVKPIIKKPVIIKELNAPLKANFRGLHLADGIKRVCPPGWDIDFQIDPTLNKTLVSFSGVTTYQQALHDILAPQGLVFLAYRQMTPRPLIIITHGAKE